MRDHHHRYSRSILSSAVATALAGTTPAWSQDQDQDQADTQQTDMIEEVIVRGVARRFRPEEQTTATGLTMSLIDTPQQVSVLTPEMLQTINADSAYEATDLVPNVQRSGYGFGFSQIVLRGVFNLSRRINQIELGNPVTSVRAYALDRFEIVRGPATAIYGVTGSFGGEINSILKQPRSTFGAEVGAELGSYHTFAGYGDVTGPLNEAGTVSARLVGHYEEYDLPLDIKGQRFPNYEGMGLAAVRWDISADTSLTFSYYRQERNTDPWDGGALVQEPDGSLSLPTVDPDIWYFSHPDQSYETLDIDFGIVELDHVFANGLRSQTKVSWHSYDEDLAYFFPFGPFGAYSLGDDEIYIYSYDVERDGEELTFNQSLGGSFNFMGREHEFFTALEYRNDLDPARFELLNSFFFGFASADWFSDAVFDGVQPRFTDGTPFNPVSGDREEFFGVRQELLTDEEDLKLSLQALLKPTDKWHILLGVLYHDNDTTTTIPFNRGEIISPPDVTETSFEETVFRFGTTYDIVEDWGFVNDAVVYYSFSEGFEPQTFTDGDGNTVSAPQEMEQHEIGLKMELFDGAVGVSMALFDYEITNIEVSSSFLGSFGGFGSTVLEGAQEATGFEFELVGEILPGWNVMANYAYMDAEIINPNNTRSTPPRTTPENSGAITTAYEFLRGPAEGLRIGATLKISGDYSFVEGTSNVARFGEPPNAGAHERFDLHASYAPRSGPLEGFDFYFTWQNVFDEDILVAKQGNPGFGIMYIDREQVTAGVRYRFN
ncbi:MAG: TonB-dependent receptor plug domain-containing protein [Xanthomonadales bacterium]|nr:TonB-dependent receptor plug domain-containing protein [Xanthomonadales bacterium]